MTKKIKPIALRSKDWIVDSFFDLLSVKPLSLITISEITENAGLDRRTFYRHFKTKEDLISYYINQISKKHEEVMEKHFDFHGDKSHNNFLIVKSFFEICEHNKDVLKILYKQNLLHLLLDLFNSLGPKIHFQFSTEEELQLENHDYFLAYNLGGLWNLLAKWLANDCAKTPEQMAEIVEQMFLLRIL